MISQTLWEIRRDDDTARFYDLLPKNVLPALDDFVWTNDKDVDIDQKDESSWLEEKMSTKVSKILRVVFPEEKM